MRVLENDLAQYNVAIHCITKANITQPVQTAFLQLHSQPRCSDVTSARSRLSYYSVALVSCQSLHASARTDTFCRRLAHSLLPARRFLTRCLSPIRRQLKHFSSQRQIMVHDLTRYILCKAVLCASLPHRGHWRCTSTHS